jgi:DNA polymerase-3 subunit delta'
MSWRHVRGHDENVAALRQSIAERRLPHALLFVGPEGIGKRLFARTLAQALLCERSPETSLDPCGACPSCAQVTAGTHPDVLMIGKPEDKHELPISTIRDLCIDLGLKPMRGTRRVAIVDDADDFSEEAANAFLKTLEEPPFGSVLILLGTSAELQLDTVLSRCRVMRFQPLNDAALAEIILENHLVDNPEDAARVAALAEGSVGRAQGLAMPDFAAFRRAMLDEIAADRGFDPSALTRRVEAFSKEAGKESAVQRARAGLLIAELTRLFRGVLWQTAGLEPPTADTADRRAMHALAQRLEPEDVFLLADRCMEANYHLLRRVNLGFLLEALFHDLAALTRR